MYMCTYICMTLLYTRNEHNIVDPFYVNFLNLI